MQRTTITRPTQNDDPTYEEEKDMNDEEQQPRMDEEYNDAVDYAKAAKVEEESLLPVATYTTVPKLSLTPANGWKRDEKTGRRLARLFGPIVATVKVQTPDGSGEKTVQGNIGFTISPDAVRKTEGRRAGEFDSQTKLYAQAVRAYQVATGQRAETSKDVLDFLANYPVRLRVGQIGVVTDTNPNPEGEPGNLVYSISAVRE